MLNENLKKIRLTKDLTQVQVANELNISRPTYTRYETGERSPDFDTLSKLASYFEVSTDYLLGISTKEKAKGVKIPVLGTVAAGIPIEAIENIEDYEEIAETMSRSGDFFALKIKGDSMEPKISQGDVVIVRKQDDVESGDIAVVFINGAEATVKKVIKQKNGLMLIATNQDVYPPTFYDNKSVIELPVKILGKVVELRAKF